MRSAAIASSAPPPALAAAAEGGLDARPLRRWRRMRLVLPDPALDLAFRCQSARRRWCRGAAPRGSSAPEARPVSSSRFRPGGEIAGGRRSELEWGDEYCSRPACRPSTSTARTSSRRSDVRLPPWLLDRLAATDSAETRRGAARVHVGHRRWPGPSRAGGAGPRARTGPAGHGRQRRGRGGPAARLPPPPAPRRARESRRSRSRSTRRITRLNHAMATPIARPSPGGPRIAADSGASATSPSLVRECRTIAGLAPGEVHRERRAQEAETSNPR